MIDVRFKREWRGARRAFSTAQSGPSSLLVGPRHDEVRAGPLGLPHGRHLVGGHGVRRRGDGPLQRTAAARRARNFRDAMVVLVPRARPVPLAPWASPLRKDRGRFS